MADVAVDEKEVELVSNVLSNLVEFMIFSFVSGFLLSIESKTIDVFKLTGKCIREQTLTRLESKLFKIPSDYKLGKKLDFFLFLKKEKQK